MTCSVDLHVTASCCILLLLGTMHALADCQCGTCCFDSKDLYHAESQAMHVMFQRSDGTDVQMRSCPASCLLFGQPVWKHPESVVFDDGVAKFHSKIAVLCQVVATAAGVRCCERCVWWSCL